jgi:hypothetical protein
MKRMLNNEPEPIGVELAGVFDEVMEEPVPVPD